MESFNLKDKVVIVTGGTGVLGNEFTKAIAQAGAIVGILGRNEEVANKRTDEIIAKGGKAISLIADVTNEEQLKTVCEKVLFHYGKIDGLVNAAGGNLSAAVVNPDADLFELNINAQKEVIDINLFGTILPTQIFGKEIAKNGGSIVNISSMASQKALTKVLGYSLAKSAIDAYTRWFAVELANRYGDKIRMNAIAPGFFLTEQNKTLLTKTDGSFTDRGNAVIRQTPFKRFGNASELTGALVWLLSDASTFVNGTIINVDGGFSAFSGV